MAIVHKYSRRETRAEGGGRLFENIHDIQLSRDGESRGVVAAASYHRLDGYIRNLKRF